MIRFGASALLCAGLAAIGFSAPASASVVYDLTLTATADTDGTPLATYNGTGTITLDFAPSSNSETDYGTNTQEAVTFSIDGQTFSGFATSVQFLNGNFRNATFAESIGVSPLRFKLGTTGGFIFDYANDQQDASGAITSVLAPAATPLPAALPMFAGGLGLVGMMSRRKKRKAAA